MAMERFSMFVRRNSKMPSMDITYCRIKHPVCLFIIIFMIYNIFHQKDHKI